MVNKRTFILIALIFAVPIFILSPANWPPTSAVSAAISGNILFIVLAALEALSFGVGVAFLCAVLPRIRKLPAKVRNLRTLQTISCAWLMLQWWPHDTLHIQLSGLENLIKIEYAFHATTIIAGFIVAHAFYTMLKEPRQGTYMPQKNLGK